jgi:hypothetical protein
MEASSDWSRFQRALSRAFSTPGQQLDLPLPEGDER